MEDLTRSEIDYKQLIESINPRRSPPLRTRRDLAETLLLFPSTLYSVTSPIATLESYFFGTFQFVPRTLDGTDQAFSLLHTTSQEDRLRLLDQVFERLMKYLPSLAIALPDEPPAWTTPEALETRKRFFDHLAKNRDFLLQGPPNQSHHTLHPKKAQEWVDAQATADRRRLASLLLSHLRYISHGDLLTALQGCVQTAMLKRNPGLPVIFLVGKPTKSNYYISLLFAHFWLEAGGQIDGVFQSIEAVKSLRLSANFLDIDDMSYSGNQTDASLRRTFKSYAQTFRDLVKRQLSGDPDYNRTYMFLPRYLIESALQTLGFQYLLIRAFMSESSYQRFSNYDPLRLPVESITHERIPYLPGVSQRDKDLIAATFSTEPPATTVYFNHKVADPPSTYLYVITHGIVPERMLGDDNDADPVNASLQNGVPGTGARFLPFVQHCDDGTGLIPSRTHSNFWDLPDEYRCPPAWYKTIDYDRKKGGTRKRRKPSHSKSVSHRNLGSKARQKVKANARSSKGSRTGFRSKAARRS